MSTEVLAAIISGSIGAFAGITKALTNFNKNLDKRFEVIERDLDNLQNRFVCD